MSKYTPELAEHIATLVGEGTPIKFAAEACGIARTTFYEWVDGNLTLRTLIEQKRAEAVRERVKLIQEAAKSGKQWTAACWWLERQHPEEFGLKQSQPDISITVQVRDCTQDTRVQVVACEQSTKQLVGTIVHNQGCDTEESGDE
jgi:hypothetical protein